MLDDLKFYAEVVVLGVAASGVMLGSIMALYRALGLEKEDEEKPEEKLEGLPADPPRPICKGGSCRRG